MVNTAVCLGALIVIQFRCACEIHFFAAGCVAVAVVFSPIGLVVEDVLPDRPDDDRGICGARGRRAGPSRANELEQVS